MDYSNTTYHPPDLASVLRTLSALAPPPAQAHAPTPHQPFPYPSEAPPQDDELEEGEYDPADDYDPSQAQLQPQPPPPHPTTTTSSHNLPPTPAAPLQKPLFNNITTEEAYRLQDPHPHLQSQRHPLQQPQPSLQPPKPSPSPSTNPKAITTYPPALRHILHLTTTTPTFLPSVRKLLRTQHQHEREWHAQRLALLSRLDSRAESRSKLDGVLAALGGKVSSSSAAGKGADAGGTGETGKGGCGKEDGEEEEKRREVERFDKKVWKAQCEMVRAMGRDLGGLGVPGFGEGWRGGEEEGRVLRGRMVGLLEDLIGGEGEGEG